MKIIKSKKSQVTPAKDGPSVGDYIGFDNESLDLFENDIMPSERMIDYLLDNYDQVFIDHIISNNLTEVLADEETLDDYYMNVYLNEAVDTTEDNFGEILDFDPDAEGIYESSRPAMEAVRPAKIDSGITLKQFNKAFDSPESENFAEKNLDVRLFYTNFWNSEDHLAPVSSLIHFYENILANKDYYFQISEFKNVRQRDIVVKKLEEYLEILYTLPRDMVVEDSWQGDLPAEIENLFEENSFSSKGALNIDLYPQREVQQTIKDYTPFRLLDQADQDDISGDSITSDLKEFLEQFELDGEKSDWFDEANETLGPSFLGATYLYDGTETDKESFYDELYQHCLNEAVEEMYEDPYDFDSRDTDEKTLNTWQLTDEKFDNAVNTLEMGSEVIFSFDNGATSVFKINIKANTSDWLEDSDLSIDEVTEDVGRYMTGPEII